MGIADFLNFNISEQSATKALSVSNDILQAAKLKCTVSCSNISSGNTVIIQDSTVGDLDFSQTCSITGSKCLMKAHFDSNLESILTDLSEQGSGSANGFGFNVGNLNINDQNLDVSLHVKNQMTQMIDSMCEVSNTNITENHFLFINRSTVGNVTFAQTGSVTNSDCIMDITAKSVVKTEETTKSKQGIGSGGLAGIIGLIAMVILVIMLAIVFAKAAPALLAAKRGAK